MSLAAVATKTVHHALHQRSWTAFFVVSGIALFSAIGWVGTSVTQASCTVAMWAAMFPPNAALPTAACIAAASITALAIAAAGGLTGIGIEHGWTYEGIGSKVGSGEKFRRHDWSNVTYPILYNSKLGLTHHIDTERSTALVSTHGAMLDKHNTTLMYVSWVERIASHNHTGTPYDHMDMALGRVITLNDSGVIRTAIGPTPILGDILDSFNEFKTNNYSTTVKRQTEENISWISFNTWGENPSEVNDVMWGMTADAEATVDNYDVEENDSGWTESFDFYSTKFCLGASPPGDGRTVDSLIVGEVYTNAYGGIDSFCDDG